MTINGFRGFIKGISQRKPLRAISRSSKGALSIGIDATACIYNAIYCLRARESNFSMERIVDLAATKCLKTIPRGTRPFFVFDGQRVALKKRSENSLLQHVRAYKKERIYGKAVNYTMPPAVTHAVATKIQLQGYNCIVAPFEADAQLGHLYANAHIDAALSIDADSLLFGCDTLLEKYDEKTDTAIITQRGEVTKSLAFGANEQSLQSACVLAGSDYAKSVYGMGFNLATKLIREFGSLETILEVIKDAVGNAKVSMKRQKPTLVQSVVRKVHKDALRCEMDTQRYLSDLERRLTRALHCFHHHIVYDPENEMFAHLNAANDSGPKTMENLQLNIDTFGTIFPNSKANALCADFALAARK